MNVLFTDEQVKMLLENESFRTELVASITSLFKDPFNCRLSSRLIESVKKEVTKGLIKKELVKGSLLDEKINEKIDAVLKEFFSKSIGKVVLESLQGTK